MGSGRISVRAAALVVAVLGAMPLVGCTLPQAVDTEAPGASVPPQVSTAAVYLVNPFTQKLVSYDMGGLRVEGTSDLSNYFYYPFSDMGQVVTAGNSITNEFKVIRISDHSVSTVVEAGPDQGIFPLAKYGETLFFSVSDYDAAGQRVGGGIVSLEGDGSLEAFESVTGYVSYGAVVGDQLFYTVYLAESDCYELWSLELVERSAKPVLERTGLSRGEVYSHGGELLLRVDEEIVGTSDSYPCRGTCYLFDQPNLLVDMFVDGEGVLNASVTDMESHDDLGTVTDMVGFRIRSNSLEVFRDGGVERFGGRDAE